MQLTVSRASIETAFEECNATCGTAQRDLAEVEQIIETLENRLPDLTRDVERLTSESDAKKKAVSELEQAFAEVEREREQHRHDVAELRVAFVELQGEVESRVRQLERLRELDVELRELSARRQEDTERTGRDLERYDRELETARQQGAGLAQEVEAARSVQHEVGIELDAERAALEAEQQRLAEIETARRQQQGRLHAAEMALSECRMRAQNLVERMRELYALEEGELAGLQFTWTDDDPVPSEEQLPLLRAEIGRLGPVNLLALEEFEEKSKRLEFLEAQRADLEHAVTSLNETIDKINRTAQFLFMETFEQVRGYFSETIRTVFDGGDGELLLTNPDDPLDTDVEIRVRPRGKRIDTLSQLSSGERALTAIALLFSIYLVKPSPFCVFDEVDAPLDDSNIGRFVNLIREFRDRTQFIVITHNKLTMEAADRLYGVTMEEEGVSKLVSVAMDGEVTGSPRKLKQRVDRAARAAAVLAPTAEAVAGFDRNVIEGGVIEGGVIEPEEPHAGNGQRRRAAARLEPGNGKDSHAGGSGSAPAKDADAGAPAPEERIV
jgi:chromosome segregation protein